MAPRNRYTQAAQKPGRVQPVEPRDAARAAGRTRAPDARAAHRARRPRPRALLRARLRKSVWGVQIRSLLASGSLEPVARSGRSHRLLNSPGSLSPSPKVKIKARRARACQNRCSDPVLIGKWTALVWQNPCTYQGRRGPRPLRGAVNGPGARVRLPHFSSRCGGGRPRRRGYLLLGWPSRLPVVDVAAEAVQQFGALAIGQAAERLRVSDAAVGEDPAGL